jgi:hypothetical protein
LESILEELIHYLDLGEGEANVGLLHVLEGEFVELLGVDGTVEYEVE